MMTNIYQNINNLVNMNNNKYFGNINNLINMNDDKYFSKYK
jgi:hypothetical protein